MAGGWQKNSNQFATKLHCKWQKWEMNHSFMQTLHILQCWKCNGLLRTIFQIGSSRSSTNLLWATHCYTVLPTLVNWWKIEIFLNLNWIVSRNLFHIWKMMKMTTFKSIDIHSNTNYVIEMYGNTESLKRGYSSIRDLVLFVNLEV